MNQEFTYKFKLLNGRMIIGINSEKPQLRIQCDAIGGEVSREQIEEMIKDLTKIIEHYDRR